MDSRRMLPREKDRKSKGMLGSLGCSRCGKISSHLKKGKCKKCVLKGSRGLVRTSEEISPLVAPVKKIFKHICGLRFHKGHLRDPVSGDKITLDGYRQDFRVGFRVEGVKKEIKEIKEVKESSESSEEPEGPSKGEPLGVVEDSFEVPQESLELLEPLLQEEPAEPEEPEELGEPKEPEGLEKSEELNEPEGLEEPEESRRPNSPMGEEEPPENQEDQKNQEGSKEPEEPEELDSPVEYEQITETEPLTPVELEEPKEEPEERPIEEPEMVSEEEPETVPEIVPEEICKEELPQIPQTPQVPEEPFDNPPDIVLPDMEKINLILQETPPKNVNFPPDVLVITIPQDPKFFLSPGVPNKEALEDFILTTLLAGLTQRKRSSIRAYARDPIWLYLEAAARKYKLNLVLKRGPGKR